MTSDSNLETSGMEDGESCEFASSGTHDAFNFEHPFRVSQIALEEFNADANLSEEWGWRCSTVGIGVALS